jgi:hypothetical protein
MAEELTLYDSQGNPVAYVSPDNDNTIYLWSGNPVGYLDGEHVYGFNGKHLGWFEDGIIWDHSGARAGFTAGTLPVLASMEPFKGFKQFLPFKGFKQFAPFKPFKKLTASQTPLAVHLAAGVG